MSMRLKTGIKSRLTEPFQSFVSGTPVACYLLGFGNLVVNPVYFLLIEHTMHQCIIVLFNINVDG
jgi:hypothetical protein